MALSLKMYLIPNMTKIRQGLKTRKIYKMKKYQNRKSLNNSLYLNL